MENYKEKIVGDVKIVMCLSEEEGLDVQDGGKWVLICYTHGLLVQHKNKKHLWGFAATPEIWCGGCRRTAGIFATV